MPAPEGGRYPGQRTVQVYLRCWHVCAAGLKRGSSTLSLAVEPSRFCGVFGIPNKTTCMCSNSTQTLARISALHLLNWGSISSLLHYLLLCTCDHTACLSVLHVAVRVVHWLVNQLQSIQHEYAHRDTQIRATLRLRPTQQETYLHPAGHMAMLTRHHLAELSLMTSLHSSSDTVTHPHTATAHPWLLSRSSPSTAQALSVHRATPQPLHHHLTDRATTLPSSNMPLCGKGPHPGKAPLHSMQMHLSNM